MNNEYFKKLTIKKTNLIVTKSINVLQYSNKIFSFNERPKYTKEKI